MREEPASATASEQLLEPPGDGVDDTLVERRNVVKGGGRDVDAVVRAAGAQVDDLRGGLLAVGVDGDPLEAVGPVVVLVRREGHHGGPVVVGTAAGSETLFIDSARLQGRRTGEVSSYRVVPGHAATEGNGGAGGRSDEEDDLGEGRHFDNILSSERNTCWCWLKLDSWKKGSYLDCAAVW